MSNDTTNYDKNLRYSFVDKIKFILYYQCDASFYNSKNKI